MRFESAVSIAAPARHVFDLYVDVERGPQWTETVTTVERLDPGPLKVGARTRLTQPKLPRAVWEVTSLVPGQSFTWVARAVGVVTTANHVVTSTGDGGARVTASIDQGGPFGFLLGLLTKRLTNRYLAIEAASLKRLCEGS